MTDFNEDNGILGQVPGGFCGEAASTLPPAAAADDSVHTVEIVAGHAGPVRISFRRKKATRGKQSHWFWNAFRADPIEPTAGVATHNPCVTRYRLTDDELRAMRKRHDRDSDVWTLLWEIRALRDERSNLQAHKLRLEKLLIKADALLLQWGSESSEAQAILADLRKSLTDDPSVRAARRERQP